MRRLRSAPTNNERGSIFSSHEVIHVVAREIRPRRIAASSIAGPPCDAKKQIANKSGSITPAICRGSTWFIA